LSTLFQLFQYMVYSLPDYTQFQAAPVYQVKASAGAIVLH